MISWSRSLEDISPVINPECQLFLASLIGTQKSKGRRSSLPRRDAGAIRRPPIRFSLLRAAERKRDPALASAHAREHSSSERENTATEVAIASETRSRLPSALSSVEILIAPGKTERCQLSYAPLIAPYAYRDVLGANSWSPLRPRAGGLERRGFPGRALFNVLGRVQSYSDHKVNKNEIKLNDLLNH